MRAVGWLGSEHGLRGGTGATLTAAELRLLRTASRRAGGLSLGWHECEFCSVVEGNGEFRYYLPGGVTYAAPTMIVHYAEQHSYRPPADLMDGLSEAVRPRWDWRAERLCSILLDASVDFDWRADAAVDLACWDDPRAYDALRRTLRDDELVDCAGEEIGRSLAAFDGRAYADNLAGENLHPLLRFGLEKASQVDHRVFIRPALSARR
jgi:hypothetical protein